MTVPQRFEAEYRVRFDEADGAGRSRPSNFLRFAQDVAWQHSEAAGFGREWYAERAMHWLVRDVDLRILSDTTYGERLSVTTEVVGWRHVWARRRAEVHALPAASGRRTSRELVAIVETDWVLLSRDGRPVRLPDEIAGLLATGRTFSRHRLELAEASSWIEVRADRVRGADVDPMGHLNNAAYLDLADEAAASVTRNEGVGGPVRYRVSYLRPAPAGAAVEVACWGSDDGSVACRISDADGVELTRAEIRPGWVDPDP